MTRTMLTRSLLPLSLLAFAFVAQGQAPYPDPAPDPATVPFQPRTLHVPVDRPYTVGPDTVFVAGNDVLIPLFNKIDERWAELEPNIKFQKIMMGSTLSIEGITSEKSALGPIGRGNRNPEVDQFVERFGYYLQQRAFGGSSIWNPELVELADQPRPGGGLYDAGQRVVDAVSKDPDGIGFTSALYRSPDVRVLPLGSTADGPFLLPTRETVGDHSYPLVQVITAFYDPKGPQADTVREFLRYVLSEQGQQAVRAEDDFTPLTPRLARESFDELR